MFFGIKPFTARRARFHQKTRFGSLGISLGVRVSCMIRVRVDVGVRVMVSNLLWSV